MSADQLCISRKVKKSESKSQLPIFATSELNGCVYPVKLKNLKANHNASQMLSFAGNVVYIP